MTCCRSWAVIRAPREMPCSAPRPRCLHISSPLPTLLWLQSLTPRSGNWQWHHAATTAASNCGTLLGWLKSFIIKFSIKLFLLTVLLTRNNQFQDSYSHNYSYVGSTYMYCNVSCNLKWIVWMAHNRDTNPVELIHY